MSVRGSNWDLYTLRNIRISLFAHHSRGCSRLFFFFTQYEGAQSKTWNLKQALSSGLDDLWWQRYCTCMGLLNLIQRKSDVGITYRIQWRALLFWMVQVMSRLPLVLSLMYKKQTKRKQPLKIHPYNGDDKRCDFFFRIPKNFLRFGQRCY